MADFTEPPAGSYLAQLEEQVRRKGVQPITSIDELRAEVFGGAGSRVVDRAATR